MTMQPIVSFVMPVYQQEAYVAEAVRSALAQTVKEIEVIAVDDGSTDASAAIIEAIDDPRLILLRRGNGGPSAALNDGMRKAQGRFIALLGGDDVAEPDRIASQLAVASARGTDLTFSLPTLINGDGRALHDETMRSVFRRPAEMQPHQVFRRLLINGNFFCAPTCLLRRDLLDTVGFFRDELIQLQDYDYWMRAAAMGKSFAILQQRTTRYRRHAENLSGRSGDEAVFGEMMACILRAIAEAPGELLAEAFPEMVPPDRISALPIDRAMIALMHPRSRSLGIALTIQAYLSRQAYLDTGDLSTSRLGQLVSGKDKVKLGPVYKDADDHLALEREHMAPVDREWGIEG